LKSEDYIQSECLVWANNEYPQLRHFGIVHIPNGGTRNKIEAAKLKTIGVRKGFPDLMIILPHGEIFFVEMKDEKGKQSESQIECEYWLKERNLEYYLIRDLESFKSLIRQKMDKHGRTGK
jgi:hypothetical protein